MGFGSIAILNRQEDEGVNVKVSSELHPNGRYDLVIDAPPVNAFSIELLKELTRQLRSIPDEARAVVIRSTGKAFSAGGDIKEMQRLSGFEGIIGQIQEGLDCCETIERCPVPVIAAVQGYCYGIGVLVAGVCDILLASEGTQFVLNEIDNGAASGAVQVLGLVPEKRVRSALLTGEPLMAEELLAHGGLASVRMNYVQRQWHKIKLWARAGFMVIG